MASPPRLQRPKSTHPPGSSPMTARLRRGEPSSGVLDHVRVPVCIEKLTPSCFSLGVHTTVVSCRQRPAEWVPVEQPDLGRSERSPGMSKLHELQTLGPRNPEPRGRAVLGPGRKSDAPVPYPGSEPWIAPVQGLVSQAPAFSIFGVCSGQPARNSKAVLVVWTHGCCRLGVLSSGSRVRSGSCDGDRVKHGVCPRRPLRSKVHSGPSSSKCGVLRFTRTSQI